MGVPNYREILRLKSLSKTTTKKLYPAKKCEANKRLYVFYISSIATL